MDEKQTQLATFFNANAIWQDEFLALREILQETALKEEFKWRAPCYTYEGHNVLILGRFKAGATLSFFKGVLLEDKEGLLIKPGEHSNEGRVLRFTSVNEIFAVKESILAYINEAIELEKAGAKLPKKTSTMPDYPEELLAMFEATDGLKEAFERLTPGRQKGYLLYFESAKQSATKTARIERYMPRILNGKGMQDCVCGHSKKYPRCDGTHKNYMEDYY